uniref:Putative defensin b n=1 Tax=Panstrongylus lignarius TaxID=156445 RepID=A0A224Y528_9HEMI
MKYFILVTLLTISLASTIISSITTEIKMDNSDSWITTPCDYKSKYTKIFAPNHAGCRNHCIKQGLTGGHCSYRNCICEI